MPVQKIKDKKNQNVYTLNFTGKAVTQLEDLKKYLNAKDWIDVVEYGLGFVQKMKELDEAKTRDQNRFYAN